MSTIKSKKVQLGTDANSANNFTLYQPATPDGTLRIGVGNADSPTEVARFDSGGYKETGSPMFMLSNTSNQTISDAVTTKVIFDDVIYDRTNNVSNSKFTVPTGFGGIYLINANIRVDGTSNTNLRISNMQVYLNGGSIQRSYFYFSDNPIRACHHTVSFMYVLSDGDELEVYQYGDTTSGSPFINSTKLYTQFSGYKIG